MANEAFKDWYIGGLQALETANEIGSGTTKKLLGYVTDPALKSAIEEGHEDSKKHAEIISRLLDEMGGTSEDIPNEVMQGIDTASDNIASSSDPDVRDAGVITTSQLALHYYIAAYGGLASTAKHLGLAEHAEEFSKLVDQVKEADQAYSDLAEQSVNKKAQD